MVGSSMSGIGRALVDEGRESSGEGVGWGAGGRWLGSGACIDTARGAGPSARAMGAAVGVVGSPGTP